MAYRGKHPNKIKSIWTVRNVKDVVMVRTNADFIYSIRPISEAGRREMPSMRKTYADYSTRPGDYDVCFRGSYI